MTALILGATSDMAIALAKRLAKQGHNLQLAGRDEILVNDIKNDIRIRFSINATAHVFDAQKFESHYSFYHTLVPKPDQVYLFFGYLGDQKKAEVDQAECDRILQTNFNGAVSILNVIANDYEESKKGTIVVVSSVAGERGRMSNYIYGSAKAGLTAYLSGLRNRLFHSGVHVLTVLPGFVETRMTKGLALPKMLTALPDQVAIAIDNGVRRKRNVIYTLSSWRLIMWIIKTLPEPIFKRLKL